MHDTHDAGLTTPKNRNACSLSPPPPHYRQMPTLLPAPMGGLSSTPRTTSAVILHLLLCTNICRVSQKKWGKTSHRSSRWIWVCKLHVLCLFFPCGKAGHTDSNLIASNQSGSHQQIVGRFFAIFSNEHMPTTNLEERTGHVHTHVPCSDFSPLQK